MNTLCRMRFHTYTLEWCKTNLGCTLCLCFNEGLFQLLAVFTCTFRFLLILAGQLSYTGAAYRSQYLMYRKSNHTLLLILYKNYTPIFLMHYRFFFRSLDLNCFPLTLIGLKLFFDLFVQMQNCITVLKLLN